MAKIYKSVDVRVDLDDFSTQDLLDELKKRGKSANTVEDCIRFLELFNYPKDLIWQLWEWNRNTITKRDLESWKEFAGKK